MSAILSSRLLRKRFKRECDERVAELTRTLREGIQIGERHE